MAPLARGFQQDDFLELLAWFPKAREIAFVGHEPEFGALVRILLKAAISCTLNKVAAISFKIHNKGSAAGFRQLVDGDVKLIKGRGKALQRLTSR